MRQFKLLSRKTSQQDTNLNFFREDDQWENLLDFWCTSDERSPIVTHSRGSRIGRRYMRNLTSQSFVSKVPAVWIAERLIVILV